MIFSKRACCPVFERARVVQWFVNYLGSHESLDLRRSEEALISEITGK